MAPVGSELGLNNRRKTQRVALRGFAKIRTGSGSLPRDCWVTDISDGGVRLFAESIEVPEQFTIMFGDGAARPRECRVVWRLGYEIGAEFTDGQDREFARRVAGAR